MGRITKRLVEASPAEEVDYVIGDDELPGFGLRVFPSGKRSYIIQYRALGRTRRFTIGKHGVWTPEMARRQARVELGRVAHGENPSEERLLDRQAITVKELCALYEADLRAGLVLGKGGRPKSPHRALLGQRRVKDLEKADIIKATKDIMAGKTAVSVKTSKLRGKSVVRGGAGAASRTFGLLGGILTYAVDAGIIEANPAFGIRKPQDNARERRLSEAEYRLLGSKLRKADADGQYAIAAQIIRLLALTRCRRGEIVELQWNEVDLDGSCLRLADSKEGRSVRPVGLPAIECLQTLRDEDPGRYVFSGQEAGSPFGAFPKHWAKILHSSGLADITPHVLRHSFASIANDLGFTETTIAALIAAADTVAGYIQSLLDGAKYKQPAYALDHKARK